MRLWLTVWDKKKDNPMKTSENDIRFVAYTTLVLGLVLGASGFSDLSEAAREHQGISRFLLGYTSVWVAVSLFNQQMHKKAMLSVSQFASEMASKRQDKQT